MSEQISQLGQDLLVLGLLNNKRNGYFVEVGANDGIYISNTLLLERDYCWRGILIEPEPTNFKKLLINRPSAICVNKGCYKEKGSLEFSVIEEDNGVLSGISSSLDPELKVDYKIIVETDTLTNILDECKAPKIIDYLSIDTEGSEYEILKSPNLFKKYKFKIITVEHNFKPYRSLIHSFLINKGYSFYCNNKHDDIYVRL